MDDIFDNWTIQVHKGVVELCLLLALAEGGSTIGMHWCCALVPRPDSRWRKGPYIRCFPN